MHLRPVRAGDLQRLHELMSMPEVYRYLADDEVPPVSVIKEWIDGSLADFAASDLGLWLLEDGGPRPLGCVLLQVDGASRRAELTYALDPRGWGRGLATRMAWFAIERALEGDHVDEIWAGADEPNTASIAVMRRLGMRFLRSVEYPKHPGVEYGFRSGDPAPEPRPEPLDVTP